MITMRNDDGPAAGASNLDPCEDYYRIVALHAINNGAASYLRHTMLKLAYQDPKRNITLLLQSHGGDVYESLACADAIRLVQGALNPGVVIDATVHGYCMSAATYLLQATNGTRRATPSSVIQVHGITAGVQGDEETMRREMKLAERFRDTYIDLFEARTKTSREKWREIMNTNTSVYLGADEALDWGLIDEISL